MDYYYHSSTHSDRLGILEGCLIDVLAEIKPSESDRLKRLNAINQLDNCLRNVQTLRGAAVKPFGSFVSNLYTKWGDLDVSVQLDTTLGTSASKKVKNNALRHIKKALHAYGLTHNVQFIPNARVPLLIFQSNYYNVSFDVSINNHLGIMKSKIVLWISQMDERFRDMVLLTKEWAKAQGINDPKCGTLNSYSLCLLIIFHFQTCENPILPPLKEIFHGNISDYVTEQNIEDVCAANIRRFRSHRRRNQSSLAQLLVSFFHKFRNIRDLATEYAICTYTGGWERISSHAKWANKPHSILIEDPFEQPENAARAVGLRQLFEISDAFTDAYNKLSSSSVLADRNALLSCLTRPAISSRLGVLSQVHYNNSRSNATIEPLRNRIEHVQRLDRHSRPSTSTVTIQRQRAGSTNMQRGPVWNPRHPN